MANETARRDENKVFQEEISVDRKNSSEFGEQDWDLCFQVLSEAKRRTSEILGKSKVSNQAKAEVEQIWTKALEDIGESRGKTQGGKLLPSQLEKKIAETLCRRGIECVDDWREYIKSMEQDGETVAEICEMLDTDVLQVKREVRALQELRSYKEEFKDAQGRGSQPRGLMDRSHTIQGQVIPSISREHDFPLRTNYRSPALTTPVVEGPGVSMLTYLRSMACADPGVFKGARHENFEEFVRRFRRKYEKVEMKVGEGCEATLVEILGDDHLGGRAKNIFTALPVAIKERGLDVVIGEMARLLSQESTAGRMRALTELRSLRMRAGQEVADFCITLENLGRKANPDCSIEDRSLEYAQILLDNLSDWPEHFQLIGALHRVDPRKAYEEVKQLALSIEQSKLMFGVGRGSSAGHWKRRAIQHRSCEQMDIAEEDALSQNGEDDMRGKISRAEEKYGRNKHRKESSSSNERHRHVQYITPSSPQKDDESRKCFKCLKYGHIARYCPNQSIRVNEIKEQENAEKRTLSEIIKQAPSMGMTVRREGKNTDHLIGGRIVKQLSLLGDRNPALIDTGSMISVVPVEILAKAQDRGIDVDALRLIEKSRLAHVFDASNNRMEFLDAVCLECELEGGSRGFVPFHISPSEGGEIILGTNALSELGVVLSVVADRRRTSKERRDRIEVKSATVKCGRVSLRRSVGVSVKNQDKISAELDRIRGPSRKGEANSLCTKQDQELAMFYPKGAISDDKKSRRRNKRRKSKV